MPLDPRSFVSPSSDEKGHSVRFTVFLPPETARAIEVVLESKLFPYQTSSDLIRHAVNLLLERLHEEEPDLWRGMLSLHRAQEEVLREEMMLESQARVLEGLSSRIEEYLRMGYLQDARRLAARIWDIIKDAPETGWKHRFRQQFMSRYSHLFEP